MSEQTELQKALGRDLNESDEEWRMVPGFANRYMASNYGRIMSLYCNARGGHVTRRGPKIMTQK